MKRKIVTYLLVSAMAVSALAACGKKDEPVPDKKVEAEAPKPEETKEEVKEEAPVEEATKEEEVVDIEDTSAESTEFSLLDVDTSMIDAGAYGTSEDGLELVFAMFTGPDSNNYVSLMTFDNDAGSGDVICGTYTAETETDEEGDEWTYFEGTDVYTGDTFSLGCCERPDTGEVAFFDANGTVISGQTISADETINYMGSAAALLSGDVDPSDVAESTDDSEEASDVTYVDGFYANNGSEDFMIFFYESSNGDVAYINDGTNEAFAEYTVEQQTLDDGTEYLLVTVGNTQLGYVENGDTINLVDADGTIYEAARLSEAEAEELHSIVTQ